MRKSNGNYIKLTLYKAKICSDSNVNAYSLKLDFCKQICETDKIMGKEIEFGGKVIILIIL